MKAADVCPACQHASHDGQPCDCGCAGSAVLRRLIAEVRDDRAKPTGYDRTYNRHNRG